MSSCNGGQLPLASALLRPGVRGPFLADEALDTFIYTALGRGESRAAIESALGEAGWAPDQIADGMRKFSDVEFPVPVPRPRVYLSARDAFQYLLVYFMLYLFVYNLGSLYFGLIDLWLPDNIAYAASGNATQVRWATAAILISYPVFLFLSWRLHGQVGKDASARNSAVRRWLTYLTLFIASAAIVVDLIYLVFSFLSGGLTGRFLLKSLVVAVLAGATFGYYAHLLRQDARVLQS